MYYFDKIGVIAGVDFNATLGNQPKTWKEKLNKNGSVIKVFIASNEIWITQIFFCHKEVHMGIRMLTTGYILIHKKLTKLVEIQEPIEGLIHIQII